MALGTGLAGGVPLALDTLVRGTPDGIASRVLAKAAGAVVTLFAFDGGQGLSEHTSPFDALVFVLSGRLRVTVGGEAAEASGGSVVALPANVPHAVEAPEPARMLLVMVRDAATG